MVFIVCSSQKKSYLCQRLKRRGRKAKSVPWMSGLVSGLQNHVRRLESARYLKELNVELFFYFIIFFYGRQLS